MNTKRLLKSAKLVSKLNGGMSPDKKAIQKFLKKHRYAIMDEDFEVLFELSELVKT